MGDVFEIDVDEVGVEDDEDVGEENSSAGPVWKHRENLTWVLRDLRRFPGKGRVFIRAGAKSPVVSNRHMALRALSPWGKDTWPPEAEGYLAGLLKEEPNEKVRDEISTLLAGKRIEGPPPSPNQ